MSPRSSSGTFSQERRQLLRLLVAVSFGCAAIGCAGPLVRSQSPDPSSLFEEEPEKRVKLIGDITATWGFNYQKVESVALVTGLAGTGSSPPPSPQRQTLLSEMQSHQVENPNKLLDSPETAMVIVRGYLPPGCMKGDHFDVEVRVAPRTDTTSLRGGWLMQSRMRPTEMMRGAVRTGAVEALAQGAVIVDAVLQGNSDPVMLTRGRIQGGGVASKDRLMGLVVHGEELSVKTSAQIGTAINSRFHTHDKGGLVVKMAKPKQDNYIELRLHPRYKNNIARYIRVIRNIALNESTTDRAQRLLTLERMILDPTTASAAALQLEAIGKDGIPLLTKALRANDPEVRFYAAEALAYLDDRECAPVLKETVINEPAFRWHALTALASMDHIDALSVLTDLLHVNSSEARYGAFRALKTRNPSDPLVRGQLYQKEFTIHAIPSQAEPMVHFTQATKPEIVIFGDQLELLPGEVLFAGKEILVKRTGTAELRISRFTPGKEDQVAVCSTRLEDCLRTAANIGARYEDLLQLLHEGKQQNAIRGRVVVDAIPQSNRLLEKRLEEIAENDASARRRVANPLPEMFSSRLANEDSEKDSQQEDNALNVAATVERQAEAEEAAKKKQTFWSRMQWWKD